MILLTGYQAPGTRGATLVNIANAAREALGNPAAGLPNSAKTVRIHGRDVLVNAEVVQLQAASAHADANQLIAWLRTMPEAPGQVYGVHGEMGASDALRLRVKNELGWRALVPEAGSTWPC